VAVSNGETSPKAKRSNGYKLQAPPSDGKAERKEGPASFFLREEIGRFVA